MTSVELIRQLCRERGISVAKLERDCDDKEEITSQIASLTAKIAPKRLDTDKLKDFLATDIESLYDAFSPDEKRFFWRSIIQEIRFDIDRNIDVLFLP